MQAEANTAAPTQVPPADAIPRSVLVRNISPLASSAVVEEFFSFCGPIEACHIRKLSPTSASAQQKQQAVLVFSEPRARDNALDMNNSKIVDTNVSITAIPDGFDFYDDPPQKPAAGLFGSGFSAFGDLFSGVGSAVAAEVEKASKVIDNATDSGVLKTAKTQMALARQRTQEFASDIDSKYQVSQNVKSAAVVSKTRATAVASAVGTSAATFASQVDSTLHISENTGKLAEKARENPAVNNGIRAVSDRFQTLLSHTGLQQGNSDGSANAGGGADTPGNGSAAVGVTPQPATGGGGQSNATANS